MKKLYVLDASSYLFKAYFAIDSMTNKKGRSTNALFGFIRSVLRLVKDFNPDYLVAVFDGPNNCKSRKEIYPEYKGHRTETPRDLPDQIQWAQDFCQLIGIPYLSVPEVEADDTMGSISQWAEKEGIYCYLCTSDKDMAQLVSDNVSLLNTHKKNLLSGPKEVEEKYGVPPKLIIDWLAITGDAADNVPGITGFGPKTAAKVLKEGGSLAALLKNPALLKGKKREALEKEGERALLSQKLVTIDTAVEIPLERKFYSFLQKDSLELKDFYMEMGFSSLLRELLSRNNWQAEEGEGDETQTKPSEKTTYTLVNNETSLQELIALLNKQTEVCFHTETTGGLPLNSDLVGIGFCIKKGEAFYVPVNQELDKSFILRALKPLFENQKLTFYGHHIKHDLHILQNYGIENISICFDIILASYLLSSHSRKHSLEHLSLEILGKVRAPLEDLVGKGKKQISMMDVSVDKVLNYCCEGLDYSYQLKSIFEKELEERNLKNVMFDIELPLLPLLKNMEREGIYLDKERLLELAKVIKQQLGELETEIYQQVGEEFNINSPKQLSIILFEKMGIKPIKKTATGYSTNADVLETLRVNYPVVELILAYRGLEKLRSTYIDALPLQVNEKTGRIHCTFNQVVAATGRLSCQDPNLQNIPVRTEEGRKIRESFIPEKEGWVFLAADYSQIELRLLAHLSEDQALIDAFNHGEDIHQLTASKIFNMPIEKVTKEQRYQAKAVNFGVIYGQQAYGLAKEIHVTQKEAARFITAYFERYPQVKKFIEESKEKVREAGVAVTLTGRERKIPEINSKNGMIRQAAERLAVNTPLQGAAADLIKLAMLKVNEQLSKNKLSAKMILQVHDELIFEAPESEIEVLQPIVKKVMEEVFVLKIPLVIDIAIGKNWKEC